METRKERENRLFLLDLRDKLNMMNLESPDSLPDWDDLKGILNDEEAK